MKCKKKFHNFKKLFQVKIKMNFIIKIIINLK